MRGKKGGVSIEKVKEMLRKGITLSELTKLVLNKKHHDSVPFPYTEEEKEAVIRALTPAKKKADILSVAAPPPANKKAASIPVAADAPAKKAPSPAKKKVPGISVDKVQDKLTGGFSFDQLQELLKSKDKRKEFLNKKET